MILILILQSIQVQLLSQGDPEKRINQRFQKLELQKLDLKGEGEKEGQSLVILIPQSRQTLQKTMTKGTEQF